MPGGKWFKDVRGRAVFGARILVMVGPRLLFTDHVLLDKALRKSSCLPVGVDPSSSGVAGHWANVVPILVTSCFSSVAFCSRFHRVVTNLAQSGR